MKKVKAFTVIFVCLFAVSYFANASGFRSGIRDYQIEVIDNIEMEKSVEKVWNITYSGSEIPVTVTKRNCNNGYVYLVRTSYFEVCYSCKPKGFGTGKLKNSWRCVPLEINGVVLNDEEIRNQRVLSPQQVNDEMALELIASYLPDLLNDQYAHLLN